MGSMEFNLSDPVSRLPYIGEKYSRHLQKLEIRTVEELLHHYPFRYQDFSKKVSVASLTIGKTVTVEGTIDAIKLVYTKRGTGIIKALLTDSSGTVSLIWFNSPYLLNILRKGIKLSVSGKVGESAGKPVFLSPEYE